MTYSSPTPGDRVIHADHARLAYGKTTVATDITLALTTPGCHLVVGPNGSGKTTLLRAIAGQIPVDGTFTVSGDKPFDNQQIMDQCVLMGADIGFPTAWKARTVLRIAADRWSTFDTSRADELVDIFGLDTDKNYGELSRGQKTALQVVVALAARCPITCLDEPYLGLDIERRGILYRELAEEIAHHPRTFIIATHEPADAASITDTVTVLDEKKMLFCATAEQLADDVVTVAGPSNACEKLTADCPDLVLATTTTTGMSRVIIDLRGQDDIVFSRLADKAAQLKLTAGPTELDTTIAALISKNRG
ncbi:AAA family ATPase [Corynebacterium mendelii]|uniref:ABC transporter ATP-binding protein n=1 Tax=Corynebacterium mendelii TaxID=2765362 RepID=A0A939E0U8_9CORY|nr:ABC transporter ATP-binding protein [Corynebacterium mendelii]MBN9644370.1 ABC transporter ATP-binding protein [Corynebacterium mendelii]